MADNKGIDFKETDDIIFSPETLKTRELQNALTDGIGKVIKGISKTLTGKDNVGIVELLNNQLVRSGNKSSQKKKASGRYEGLNSYGENDQGGIINDMFYQERDRIKRYTSYEQIFEYIPEMADVIETVTNNVLSPDQFSSGKLNVAIDETKITDENKTKEILENIQEIKKHIKLDENSHTNILRTCIFGDQFFAILNIDTEIENLITSDRTMKSLKENSFNLLNNTDSIFKLENAGYTLSDSYKSKHDLSLLIPLSESSYFHDAELTTAYKVMEKHSSEIVNILNEKFIINTKKNFIINEAEAIADSRKAEDSGEAGTKTVSLNSIYYKKMDPNNVIKLVSGTSIIGYYYIEFSDELQLGVHSSYNISNTAVFKEFYGTQSGERESVNRRKIRLLSEMVTKNLTAKLTKKILKDNPHFKETIYNLLLDKRFLDQRVSITFFETADVVHYKLGGDVYGRSIFYNSLFAAKLYLASLMSTIMQKIVKSADERIFYVETGLDQDVEGSVMQFVRDIKLSNFSADDFGDINSTLRKVSAFKDLYIPVVDGAKPVEVDSLQGTQVDINNDFLEFLRKSMISGTGVPETFLGARQEVEFARTLTMQNGNFTKRIIRIQASIENADKRTICAIYKMVHGEDISDVVNIFYTRPITLNTSTLSDAIGNASTIIDTMINTMGFAEDVALAAQIKRRLLRKYLPQVDWADIDEIIRVSKYAKDSEKLDPDSATEDDDEFA